MSGNAFHKPKDVNQHVSWVLEQSAVVRITVVKADHFTMDNQTMSPY